MTSTDDVDQRAEVRRLRRAGETIRAIAERLGLSKSRVGRIVADDDADDAYRVAFEDDDDLVDDDLVDDDLDDRDLALMNPADTRYRPQAPFRFVGMEPTTLDIAGVDPGDPVDVERFLDANGVSVSMAIYREDFEDGTVDRGYIDDAVEQIKRAGYRESAAIDGRWHWVGPTS